VKDLHGTVSFVQEDMDRLPRLYQIAIAGDEDGVGIIFKGQLTFKAMGHMYLSNKVNDIDASGAKFNFGTWISFGITYCPDLLKDIKDARQVTIYARPDEVVDLKNAVISYPLEIKNAKEVRNFSFRGGRDSSFSLEGTTNRILLDDVGISTEILSLKNVDVGKIRWGTEIRDSLEMDNVNFQNNFVIESYSHISCLRLLHTKLNMVSDDEPEEGKEPYPLKVLNWAVKIEILDSELRGVDLPSFSGIMTDFSVVSSTFTMEHLPDFPEVKKLELSGKGSFKDENYPLRIYKNLEGLLLTDLKLKKLNIELISPKNLQYIYFMGNPDLELSLLRKENLKDLPGYFMVVTDKAKEARRLRRLFDRKGVGFMDWLNLDNHSR
jgi:hypothetical protein